ncbi:unnamed protein product [Effrenium voratum]|nr:unnamed protein product [Effrenium voratum]
MRRAARRAQTQVESSSETRLARCVGARRRFDFRAEVCAARPPSGGFAFLRRPGSPPAPFVRTLSEGVESSAPLRVTNKDLEAWASGASVRGHAFTRASVEPYTASSVRHFGAGLEAPGWLAHFVSTSGMKSSGVPNQDAYSFTTLHGWVICIACDGHGEHGEVIAERVSRVLPLFFSMHLADGVEEALRRAFLAAQSDLEESFGAMQVYSGATVVMCCFQEGAESVWCAYVGDSRLVVGDMETGQPVYCTDEHKAHHPQEYQRLEAAGAQVIQKRYDDGEVISRIFIPKTGVPGLAMSRSLGDGCLKKYGVSAEPDICEITGQWQACQFPAMMLGSDGLWARSPVFPERRRASEMSAMDWDWGQQIRSDDWLIAMLKGGALSAFLAVVMLCVKAMQNSGATIAPKGSKRDEKKMKRIRLPEDCVRLIEKEVKDKEEHAEHANGIREKMYDRVCGAADNVFEILRRLRRTEDWWDRHEVVEEVVQEKYSDLRPVLVFVNTRSGGQQGSKILHEMQEYLHAAQVVELQREGPDAALQWWDKTKLPYRILVCGGDGTAGWVLGALEQLKAEDKLSQTQPLGILPIGTGNDLARVLNWGGGYTNSSVLPALQQLNEKRQDQAAGSLEGTLAAWRGLNASVVPRQEERGHGRAGRRQRRAWPRRGQGGERGARQRRARRQGEVGLAAPFSSGAARPEDHGHEQLPWHRRGCRCCHGLSPDARATARAVRVAACEQAVVL